MFKQGVYDLTLHTLSQIDVSLCLVLFVLGTVFIRHLTFPFYGRPVLVRQDVPCLHVFYVTAATLGHHTEKPETLSRFSLGHRLKPLWW